MSVASDAAQATAAEPVGADVVTIPAYEWAEPDPVAEQPRDWLGRPLIEKVDAVDESDREPYRRISTVAGTLTEQTSLRTFLMRQLAVGLVKAPDLQGVIAGLNLDDKGDRKTLDELIETASDRAGGKAKALWGTAVHRFTEPGAPADWTPPDMRPDVESYWRETEARGIRRELSETFVVNDEWKCSGTFDGAFYVPGWSDGPDGGLILGDVKTGGLHPGQHALQLAAYASGVLYDYRQPLGQKRTPLPRIRQDVGLLLHTANRTGHTELYLIDLAAGRHALALSKAVFDWRARKDLAQLFDAVQPPLIEAPAPAPAPVALPYDNGGTLPPAPQWGDPAPVLVEDEPPAPSPAPVAGSYHEQVQRDQRTAYVEGGLGASAPTLAPATAPAAPQGLGPSLQQQAEAARKARQQAEDDARAARAQARDVAERDPDAPMHEKVTPARDIRAELDKVEADRVLVLRRERAEREAQDAAPRATPYIEVSNVVAPVLDVNGNPVELKGDGFDGLRIVEPLPVNPEDATKLVAHHLGGAVLSLPEQVAAATTEPELTRLWERHAAEWTPELTTLVRQRLAVLQPGGRGA